MMTVPTVLEGALGTEFPTQTPTEGGAFEAWLKLVEGEASADLPPVEEAPAPDREPNRFLLALGLPFLQQEVIPTPIPQEAQTQSPVLRGVETSRRGDIVGGIPFGGIDPSEQGGLEISANPVGDTDLLQPPSPLEGQESAAPASAPSESDGSYEPLKPLSQNEGIQEQAPSPPLAREATAQRDNKVSLPTPQDAVPIQSLAERSFLEGHEAQIGIEGDTPHAKPLPIRTPSDRAEPLTASPTGIHPTFALGGQAAAPAPSITPERLSTREVANSAVVEQVAQFVEQMTLDPDRNRVHLQLNPPELGNLEIQIRVEGSEVQAWVQAEHDLTRRALEQSLQQLRDQLASRGLHLSGFSISTGNPRSGASPFKPHRVTFGSDPWNPSRHATESVHLHGQWSVWA